MSTPDPVLLQQLAQAHGFRLEALDANRAGLLSAAQANDLGRPSKAGSQVAAVESFLRVRQGFFDWLLGGEDYSYETDAGLSFRVPERGTRLIAPGQRYRLYYTVADRQLVNLEPVGSRFSVALSAAEVSAILGVPVTEVEHRWLEQPTQLGLAFPAMTLVSFANLAAGIRATYGFQLGGRALKHSQLREALIRRRGERLPALGDEAFLVQNRFVFVYCGDVFLHAAVWVFQPGQVGTDRQLTLALAQALVQKLGR